jgi:hypothetical protein
VTSTPANSFRSPSNGPHGIKFFVDPTSGRIDLKAPSDGVVAGSLDRRRSVRQFPSTTQQPRSMSVTSFATPAVTSTVHKRLLPASVSSYCTLARNKGQRLLPDETVLRFQVLLFGLWEHILTIAVYVHTYVCM